MDGKVGSGGFLRASPEQRRVWGGSPGRGGLGSLPELPFAVESRTALRGEQTISPAPLRAVAEVRPETFKAKLCARPPSSCSLPPALGRCFPYPNSTQFEFPGISGNTSINQGIRWVPLPPQLCPLPFQPQPRPTLSLPSGLLDSLNARDISVKIFEDLAQSWYWILV